MSERVTPYPFILREMARVRVSEGPTQNPWHAIANALILTLSLKNKGRVFMVATHPPQG
jgi:hypothetical protein